MTNPLHESGDFDDVSPIVPESDAPLPPESSAVAAVRAPTRSRLKFAGYTLLGLATVGGTLYGTKPFPGSKADGFMADTGITLSQRSAKLSVVQSHVQERREKFMAHYLENGDVTDLDGTVLDAEWVNYLRGTNQAAVPVENFLAQAYRPFMKRTQDSFGKRLADEKETERDADIQENGTRSVGLLLHLKAALYEQLGETEMGYDKDFNTVADPLLSKTLQCRSGTKLFLLAAREHAAGLLQPGEKLVQIHTSGHVFPGLLAADGRLFGIEMTKRGKGLISFGALAELGKSGIEIQVLDANHALAQDAIGQRAFGEETTLANTVKPDQNIAFGGGFGRPNTDQFGFGKADVPSGRQPIDRVDHISPRTMQGEGGVYGMAQPESETQDFMKRLTTQEKILVREYMQHTKYFSEMFRRHAAVLSQIQDRPTMSKAEAQGVFRQTAELNNELVGYLQKNDIVTLHHATRNILERHGLELSFDALSVLERMQDNEAIAERLWNKAHRRAR